MSNKKCSFSRTQNPNHKVSTVVETCDTIYEPDVCKSAYVATSTTANFCKWNGGTNTCEKGAPCIAELCRHIPLDGTFGVTYCSDIKDDGHQGPNFNLKRACESFFERGNKPFDYRNANCLLYPEGCRGSDTQACLLRSADDPKVFQEIHSCPTFEKGNCNECKDPSGSGRKIQGTEIFRHKCRWDEGGGTEVFCNCGTQM